MEFFAPLIRLIFGVTFSVKSFVLWIFATVAISFVIKIIVGLGFGYVTYTLSNYTLDYIFSQLTNELAVLPPEVTALLNTVRLNDAISIIFSGLSIRLALIGFNQGQRRVLSIT